jgi:glycosyltransferase involved in cell wall biosynthesis
MILYFEVGPLKEREYTGIAQVTAALAEQVIGDRDIDSEFFFGRMVVPKKAVEDLLRTRNGELLEWYLQRAHLEPAPRHVSGSSVGFFPNRKTGRRAFAKDCQIIHDLSTLLTPQFHHSDTVNYHTTSMEQDILTNDATFCVSEATRSDVHAYFPEVALERLHTLQLAVSTQDGAGDVALGETVVEPYILVLGTIEPRKNAAAVLRYIKTHPNFTKRYRVVFLGRFGWGRTVEELVAEYELQEQHRSGRIIFPGFVTERVKNLLIRHARVLVYPSLFEGFGLPVLEAATLGVPCVTTKSSSLPEAAGPQAYYFDPFAAGDFDRSLMKAVVDCEMRREDVRKECMEWSKRFSWADTYAAMKATIGQLFPTVEH